MDIIMMLYAFGIKPLGAHYNSNSKLVWEYRISDRDTMQAVIDLCIENFVHAHLGDLFKDTIYIIA